MDMFAQVAMGRRTSAPASLANSHESLLMDHSRGSRSSTPSIDPRQRFSADLSKLDEQEYMSGSTQSSGKSGELGKSLGHE